MDVIARLFVIVYPNGDPYGVRADKAMAESYARNMGAGWEVVEYVPADQSRGAVGALDSIAEVLDRGIPDDRKLATVVRLVHAARSTTSGGQ